MEVDKIVSVLTNKAYIDLVVLFERDETKLTLLAFIVASYLNSDSNDFESYLSKYFDRLFW